MRSTLTNVIAFAVGAAIGSAVTWKYLKVHFEQIAREEIESVKETFSARKTSAKPSEGKDEKKEESNTKKQLDIDEYAGILRDREYVDYATTKMAHKKDTGKPPYVISPEEFSENNDYLTVSLTYYADKVLTDEYDNVILNVDELVGEDSLTHFGEYEDDSVFVRNDELRTDYEILLDIRKYEDVMSDRSRRSEG